MKRTIIISLGVLAIFVLASMTFVYLKPSEPIVYIKLSEVYEKFELRKELETGYKKIENARKNLVDSMEFRVTRIQQSGDKILYEEALNEYIKKRKEMEDANDILSKNYEEQIWNQINTYCQEYGKQEGYQYILGAQGSGILMFADTKHDVTNALVEYINKAYNGKQAKK